MAFHPHYMDEPIKNGSAGFNYYRWNADGRKNASQHIKTDTRVQPKPEQDIQLDPQIRIMGKAGSVLIFSQRICTRRSRTRLVRRASASISARSMSPMSRRRAVPRTSTPTAPGRRCATSCAAQTSSACRKKSLPSTTMVRRTTASPCSPRTSTSYADGAKAA